MWVLVSVGYAGTSLVRRLGIREGMRVMFDGAPRGYVRGLEGLPVVFEKRQARPPLDFAQLFVTDVRRLRQRVPKLRDALTPEGMLWVSWPEKVAGVVAGIDEAMVRAWGLESGLVDVQVCAVDDVWSGLKFVRRVADR